MRIAIGAPGNGALLKDALAERLAEDGRVSDVLDLSTPEITYPEVSFQVARAVAEGRADRGLLICGTGVGISLAANKVKGIRACVCSEPYTAKLSRVHNNSNVLAFGARVVGSELAKMITEAWLDAEFEGGRHERRVNMIMEIENR